MTIKNLERSSLFHYRIEEHISVPQQKIQNRYAKILRETLKFQPEIQKRADRVKKNVALKMNLSEDEITFVGVHNRRTDYNDLAMNWYAVEPLSPTYFIDAMDYFRY